MATSIQHPKCPTCGKPLFDDAAAEWAEADMAFDAGEWSGAFVYNQFCFAAGPDSCDGEGNLADEARAALEAADIREALAL